MADDETESTPVENPRGGNNQQNNQGPKTADQILKEVTNEMAKQKAAPFKEELKKLLKEEEDFLKGLKLVRIKIAKASDDYNSGIL